APAARPRPPPAALGPGRADLRRHHARLRPKLDRRAAAPRDHDDHLPRDVCRERPSLQYRAEGLLPPAGQRAARRQHRRPAGRVVRGHPREDDALRGDLGSRPRRGHRHSVHGRRRRARLGVSTRLIDETLYDAFGQRQVSTIYTSLNQYHVVMELEPRYWERPDALSNIYLRSRTGQTVPLTAVTKFQTGTGPIQVNHQGLFPSVTVFFNLAPNVALGDAVQAIDAAERTMDFP